MAGETTITVIGNLTADPEMRFSPSGDAVANFTIASTPRTFDRQANEWKDGETLFMRGSVWREAAENVAETLAKGMRVIAQGRLKQRSYEKDGQTRTIVEMDVDEIGPSLKYATAKVTRTQRNNQGGGFGGGNGQPPATGQPGNAPQGGGGQGGGWGNPGAQNGPQGGGWNQPNPQQGGGWNQPPMSNGGGWGNPGQQGGDPPF